MKIRYLFGIALLTGTAYADTSFIPAYEEVRPVPAVRKFCADFPAECRTTGSVAPFVLLPDRRKELEEVNSDVNRQFVYKTDMVLYGVDEQWTLNSRHGDCEDFAIQKRHRLLRRGWPSSALLITVVRAPEGNMHAILIAHTSDGDFMLDKTTRGPDPVRPWSQTSYIYIAQQSPQNPHRWVSLVSRLVSLTDIRMRWWTASK